MLSKYHYTIIHVYAAQALETFWMNQKVFKKVLHSRSVYLHVVYCSQLKRSEFFSSSILSGAFDDDMNVGMWFLHQKPAHQSVDVKAILFNETAQECLLFSDSLLSRPRILSESYHPTNVTYFENICAYGAVIILPYKKLCNTSHNFKNILNRKQMCVASFMERFIIWYASHPQ